MTSLIIIFLMLCFFYKASLSSTQNSGFSVELIHHDSLKSPFYNPRETQSQRVSKAFHHSINRATYLFNKFSFLTTSTNNNHIPKIPITIDGGGGYLLSFSIGTPSIQLYGLFDTGTAFTWFKCKPCEPPLNQTSSPVQIFDPSKSSTFRTIPCSSPKCNYAPNNCSTHDISTNKQKCQYASFYAGGDYSQGDVGIDVLTLNSSNAASPLISFPGTVIGCGHNNSWPDESSGIVGFGSGPSSFPSQLGSSIGGRFSYCLVPLYPAKSNISSSKLSFGDEALVSGLEGTVSTPFVPLDESYILNLESLSVGDKIIIKLERLITLGKPGNILFDTGSTFNYLPNDIYYKLESAVASIVQLKRVKDPTQQLSLCYETTSKKNLDEEVPIITAHFTGADVQLNAVHNFIPIDNNVVCFAFLPYRSSLAVLGNIAQHNFLVGIDRLKEMVSFKPMDCTKY